ncbi:MAG: hypothetical protein KGJ51_10380 [Acidobacteriota bacterium]|nr:hypothetical protein [Acidobacteriota bacterium]
MRSRRLGWESTNPRTTPPNNRYWYDAEGQLCAVQSVRYGTGPVMQYLYDAALH